MQVTKRPTIALCPCESSQIEATGYDESTRTLAIQFRKKNGPGSVYHYADVSPEVAAEFGQAESRGKYFGAHIKDVFTFEKLPDPDTDEPDSKGG